MGSPGFFSSRSRPEIPQKNGVLLLMKKILHQLMWSIHGKYANIYRVSYTSGGSEFIPSTALIQG